MVLYLCVLIVFSLCQESLKLILVNEPLPEVILSQLFIRASLRQHTSTKKSQLRLIGEDHLAHIRTIVVS
jgi:hypothetical protein